MPVYKSKKQALKSDPNQWVMPGQQLSEEEFRLELKKAEEGRFLTVQESMEQFEIWLKSREKK
jgi:hypothetical protein